MTTSRSRSFPNAARIFQPVRIYLNALKHGDLLTLAPSPDRSATRRPARNLAFPKACLPTRSCVRLIRPMRDQWSALSSFILVSKTSRVVPKKSCPTMTSGSALWIWTAAGSLMQISQVRSKLRKTKNLPRVRLRTSLSDLTVLICCLGALASKYGGNFSPRGRMTVCGTCRSFSTGVGSSILSMGAHISQVLGRSYHFDLQSSHTAVLIASSSCVFMLWLMIVRALMLITVKGGISLGADSSESRKMFTFLGSLTRTSSRHQVAYHESVLSQAFVKISFNLCTSLTGFCVTGRQPWISSQQGPMIFRLMTNISKALVFVPKTLLNVAPLRSPGNCGSTCLSDVASL